MMFKHHAVKALALTRLRATAVVTAPSPAREGATPSADIFDAGL
jgi:hypothetical protein